MRVNLKTFTGSRDIHMGQYKHASTLPEQVRIWLTENVGPVLHEHTESQLGTLYKTPGFAGMQVFSRYLLGDDNQLARDYINDPDSDRSITSVEMIVGDGWQMHFHQRWNAANEQLDEATPTYHFVSFEDEMLAMQFKLTCL